MRRRSDDVEMRAMFAAFDKDRNGYIEPDVSLGIMKEGSFII